MATFGYFLGSEDSTPQELVEQAKRAEAAGFESLWISDHFHPWTDAQGQSPFVWGVIGAISQATNLPLTTAVTCPTVRIHPAIIAHAAATAAVLLDGKFVLGVGSGEALNEHVLGDRWPSVGVRLEMLEEAIQVIRLLLRGDEVSFHGKHYEVQDARIYTRPKEPIPIYISGFGPQAAALAGRVGDGYITMMADEYLIDEFRIQGKGKPVQAGTKVSWDRDADTALDTAHRLWANEQLPGQLLQTLPRPRDFADAATLVPKEKVKEALTCGDDPEAHAAQLRSYVEAGADEVYVQQIGPDMEGFFNAYEKEVLPLLRG